MPGNSASPSALRIPVVLVADEPTAFGASRTVAELAGARVVLGWCLPREPWNLAAAHIVVQGPIESEPNEEAVVAAVVRGAGAIVGIDRGRPASARLVDALRRTAPVLDWRDCPTMQLDVTQIRLLHHLSQGAKAREAANALFLSVRTAHRRMAEARDLLGAASTNSAAAQLLETVRVWAR